MGVGRDGSGMVSLKGLDYLRAERFSDFVEYA